VSCHENLILYSSGVKSSLGFLKTCHSQTHLSANFTHCHGGLTMLVVSSQQWHRTSPLTIYVYPFHNSCKSQNCSAAVYLVVCYLPSAKLVAKVHFLIIHKVESLVSIYTYLLYIQELSKIVDRPIFHPGFQLFTMRLVLARTFRLI
jgi:hypothetical protein